MKTMFLVVAPNTRFKVGTASCMTSPERRSNLGNKHI